MSKPLYARLTAGVLSLFAALSICSFACPARAEETASPSNESAVQAAPTNMYRLCSPTSGEHFYTASAGEKKALIEAGWRYEGIGWIAPSISSIPVYRLYNVNAGDHHYTTSAGERDLLVEEGWNDEGIGWYSDQDRTVAILRQYNPYADTGAHNFTSSEGERNLLVEEGWNDEGIGWYGLQKGSGVEKPTVSLSFAAGSSSLAASLIRSDYSTGHLELSVMDEYDDWHEWVEEDVTAEAYSPINAIRMRFTGDLLGAFDLWYRVSVPGIGWAGWAKNGTAVGSTGLTLGIDRIEVAVTMRHGEAPGNVGTALFEAGRTPGKIGYQNPEGFYQVSSYNVTITDKAVAPWDYVTPSRISMQATREECVEAFVERAYEYLGSPYMWDYSCAPEVGVDCIGLVYQCAYACGMDLGGGVEYDDFNPWAHYSTGPAGWHSHDSNNFWEYGKAMHVPLSDRQRGDVIVWAGHSAIYIGDDTIIEAYDGLGVVTENVWAHGTPWGCIRLFQ